MMRRGDRQVLALVARRAGPVLLFPHVCYAAGVGGPGGDAIELSPDAGPARVGRAVARLLERCKRVDVEAMREQQRIRLRAFRTGGGEDNAGGFAVGPEWQRIVAA